MNKFMGIGYLVADLENRVVGDKVVANGAIAIKRKYSTQDKTDFINISIWGKSAEVALKYTKKGDLLAVMGELQIERKNDNYYTRVNVEDFKFMSSSSRIDKQATTQETEPEFDIDVSKLFNDQDNDLPF